MMEDKGCRRNRGVTVEGIEHSVAGRPTKKTTSRLNHGLPSLVQQQRCNRLVVIRNKYKLIFIVTCVER